MLQIHKLITSSLLFSVLCPLVSAQEVLYSIDGDDPDERFGLAVSGVGDLNADGHDDFIVGACQDPTNGNQAGEARVFSGVDGSLMFRVLGESSGDFFGNAVSGAGDVNADGTPDFIVGAICGYIRPLFNGSRPGELHDHEPTESRQQRDHALVEQADRHKAEHQCVVLPIPKIVMDNRQDDDETPG